MMQLTRWGTACTASAGDLERLRGQFDRDRCIRLHSILEPGLLRAIARQIDTATFSRQAYKGLGTELCMEENPAEQTLVFLANDPQLFRLIRQITGCGPIGCFTGRVYRMVPGSRHHTSWHNDRLEHRIVGMSINLSEQVYSGGIFQLRDSASPHMLYEIANTGFSDAIIFQISPRLEHRVTEVDGSVPKTAFAGWFQSQPDFYARLRNQTVPNE